MSRNTVAFISLPAIRHNFKVAQKLAPNSKIASVVKADGYGHGITQVAGALQESELLAVATAGEATALRNAGWRGRLLMLEGFANPEDFDCSQSLNAEVVIHHPSQLEILRRRKLASQAVLWLKLDTGMHRLGFGTSDVKEVYSELVSIAGQERVELMSHFACADEPDKPMTQRQVLAFDDAVRGLEARHSLSNSAAILNYPSAHRDIVRPGILLYGISPLSDRQASEFDLRPAMTLTCELVAINHCRKGDTVGYGASYTCPENMPIGVAAIGYGDGYSRHFRNGTPVLVNGKLAWLAGRVSMDLITLDLRGHDDTVTGDKVTLWGEGLPIETVAPWAGSLPYELVCGVTGRVPRVVV